MVYVLDTAGKDGLSRGKIPYRLHSVVDDSQPDGPVIFSAPDKILCEDFGALRLREMQHEGDARVTQVSLQWLTPLRVKKYGGYQETGEKITFVTFIDLLLGRLESLDFLHCGGSWAPSTQLREAARQVRVVTNDLRPQRLERYSNRHRQKLPLHGMVGTISFEGNLADFLPLLRMGEYLHIGAGTAFGLVRYQLHTNG
jgi:hypothetical protein